MSIKLELPNAHAEQDVRLLDALVRVQAAKGGSNAPFDGATMVRTEHSTAVPDLRARGEGGSEIRARFSAGQKWKDARRFDSPLEKVSWLKSICGLRQKRVAWQLLLAATVLGNFGCWEKRDLGLDTARQKAAVEVLTTHRGKPGVIDIDRVVGADISRVCIQGPYMFQDLFEKEVGRSVEGFRPISDGRYAWWLFDKDGRSRRIEILTVSVMAPSMPIGGSCFSARDHVLEISSSPNVSYYTFRRK